MNNDIEEVFYNKLFVVHEDHNLSWKEYISNVCQKIAMYSNYK